MHADYYKDETTRQKLNKRFGALRTERSSFVSHWKELSRFIQPRRGRFLVTDRNKGDKRWEEIINSRATLAHRIARAGIFAGIMSPTRPWHTLETSNPDLMESAAVRTWLNDVVLVQREIFSQSNLYRMAPRMIGEMLTFGTGAMLHVDSFDDVARFYTQTVGSYVIAQNDKYEVDTFAREFQMTTSQMVERFGYDKCSYQVQCAYDKSDYDAWFDVHHFLLPNEMMKPSSPFADGKPFASIYYEPGDDTLDGTLKVEGFNEFPGYFPRWDVTGEDVYATDCPGMTSLGDIKGLQVEEKRKAQGLDLQVNPPLKGPPSLRNSSEITSLPGGLNIYEPGQSSEGLTPVYNVNLPFNELRIDIESVESRINEVFFVDLFLAISNMKGIQPRNQLDIMQRHEERLLQIGPVLESMHNEFLSKLIDRTFNQMARAGILPDPPPELEGVELNIKFISSLAMAQRAVATESIDKTVAFAGALAGAGWTEALDKVDADQSVDEYAKAIGTPPRIIVPDDVVAERRQQRQQMQQQQQAMEMAQSAANTAKMASDAKTGDKNLLTDIAAANSG